MTALPKGLADAAHHFVGNDLSGVVFVRDYVQLQFNALPIVNAFTPITVIGSDGSSTVRGSLQFANLLIAQINKVVHSLAFVPDSHLSFRFQDGSEINVSVRPEHYVGPEAVNLVLPNGGLIVF